MWTSLTVPHHGYRNLLKQLDQEVANKASHHCKLFKVTGTALLPLEMRGKQYHLPQCHATALPFLLQQSHKRAGHVTSASNSLCAKQTGHSLLQNQAHIWSPVTHSLIGFFLLQRVTYTHSRFSHVFQYTNAVKREKRKLNWPKLKY